MYHFQVSDMTCSHCVQTVEKAIRGVDANARVTIDLDTKDVAVDSTAPAETLTAAIEDVGYTSRRTA